MRLTGATTAALALSALFAFAAPHHARADALDDAIAFLNEKGLKQGGQPISRDTVGKLQSVLLPQRAGVEDGDLVHLAALPDLRTLDLSSSKVTDAGMPTLAGIRSLRSLKLVSTTVGDDGVAALSGLPELATLGLDRTPITDKALVAASGLAKLRWLQISETDVTAEGLRALGNARALRLLDVGRMNSFTPDMMEAIGAIKGLESLSLRNNDLDPLMAGLEGSGIKRLGISNARLSDAGGVSLGALARLTNLTVLNTQIGDATIAAVAGLPDLELIQATGTAITDTSGPDLARLAKLKTLWIGQTKVGDGLLPHLAGLPLESLALDETAVTDAGLKALEKITTLKNLSITKTAVTDAGAGALQAALPALKLRR